MGSKCSDAEIVGQLGGDGNGCRVEAQGGSQGLRGNVADGLCSRYERFAQLRRDAAS